MHDRLMGTHNIVVAQLNFLAMTAKSAMAEFAAARSLIFLSATLSPAQAFQQELGIFIANVACLQAQARRSATVIVQNGAIRSLRATHQILLNPQFLLEIFNVVVIIAGCAPHGVLAFFPPYNSLALFRTVVESSPLFETVSSCKKFYWESRIKSEFDDLQ